MRLRRSDKDKLEEIFEEEREKERMANKEKNKRIILKFVGKGKVFTIAID